MQQQQIAKEHKPAARRLRERSRDAESAPAAASPGLRRSRASVTDADAVLAAIDAALAAA